jgi:putative ABC transport system ATP-binding protein
VTDTLIDARAIRRVATDGKPLLSEITFALRSGDRLALVGPTGAGKSLTLRVIARLDPFDGELLYRGKRLPAEEVPRYRSKVMLLPQQPSLPSGMVEHALREALSFQSNKERAFDFDDVSNLLRRIGRNVDFLAKQTSDLSGGEQQIAVLLRALQLQPTVLLLDEPTAAMDAATTRKVEDVLVDWAAESTRAYAWITHDRGQADRVANRTIELDAGRIVSDTHG